MRLIGKVCPNDQTSWDETLALYRQQLQIYLDYLVQCRCGEQILADAEAEVRERQVPGEFKHRFLLRSLVRNVIQHLGVCPEQGESSHRAGQDCPNPLVKAPVQERLVYFMRDILEYSTRDTSLLIGITDAQVERLLLFARKRIDMTEGTSSLEIEAPEGFYFRWRFVDLHLRCTGKGSFGM
jgi:hypothetical protein